MAEVVCDVCAYPKARVRQMTRTYGKGKDLLVIENVPVVICPNCGTNYLTAETLKKLEDIKHHKELTITRPVEVATFC